MDTRLPAMPLWALTMLFAVHCAAPLSQNAAAPPANLTSPSPVPATPPQAKVISPVPSAPLPPAPLSPAVQSPSVSTQPGWLGVAMTDRKPSEPGVIVRRVLRGTPAAVAGVEVGDILLAVNGQPLLNSQELIQRINAVGAGGEALLAVQRKGDPTLLRAPLIANPGTEGLLELGYVGEQAPEFEGLSVVQGNVSERLSGLEGQVVVLEFWASWCVACRALLPTLNAWNDAMAPRGGRVISITVDPLEKAARDAFQLGVQYPVLSDPEGETTSLYQAMALPTLFVIDRKGVVRAVSVGYGPEQVERLGETLERLLQES